jgi:ADP-ribose pyrophosphatase
MKDLCYNARMNLTSKHKERFLKIVHKYQGNAVGFRVDQIRLPDGRSRGREYLTHPGAVGVLAFTPNRQILLVKQFRYPVGKFTFEIPAGKLAKGEDPLDCVRRELEEETGYVAKKIGKLLSFWPTAAFSDELIHLYVAIDLRPTRMNPDDDEYIELVSVTPKRLEKMVYQGLVQDSKTIIAYLAWKNRSNSPARR